MILLDNSFLRCTFKCHAFSSLSVVVHLPTREYYTIRTGGRQKANCSSYDIIYRMATRRVIYLDHAATTPVHPDVVRAMQPYFSEEFGNPGGLYGLGQRARDAVEDARRELA